MRRRLVLLSLLLAAPLASAQEGRIVMGPDPVEGLDIRARQGDALELLPNTSADLAFTLANVGNRTLRLRIDALELAFGGSRHLDVRASVANATLEPGETLDVTLNVTALATAPGGRERRLSLLAEDTEARRISDKLTLVRFGGPPCADCPPEEEPQPGMGFQPGAGGQGTLVRRPAGGSGSPTETPPPVEDAEPYAETPGPGAWGLAAAGLAAALLGGRRR